MKNYPFLSRLAVLAAALTLGLAACDETNEPPVGETPEVALKAGTPSETAITFTITPSHALKCAYMVRTSEEKAPDAAGVLYGGTAVAADEATPVEVKALAPATAYTIYAAASNGDRVSTLQQLEMTTLPADEPEPQPVETYTLEKCHLAKYFVFQRDDSSPKCGEYYLQLLTGSFDEREVNLIGTEDFALYIAMFGALATDEKHPRLPEGTYPSSNIQESGTFWIPGPGYLTPTYMQTYDDTVHFFDGTIKIAYEGDNVRFTADMHTLVKTGEEQYSPGDLLRYEYFGPMPFINGDLPEELDITCTEAEADWYGNAKGNGTSMWKMQMRNVSISEGQPTEPGELINVTFFGEPAADIAAASLTEGTYTFGTDFAVRTMQPGVYEGGVKPEGTYLTRWDGTRDEITRIEQGTMTIARTGEEYTVTVDFTTIRDTRVKATYTGPIPFTDRTEKPVDPGLSTLTGDVTITQEDIEWADLYNYGVDETTGLGWWEVHFSNMDGMDMAISLYVNDHNDLPSGTYTVSEEIADFSIELGDEYDGNAVGSYTIVATTYARGFVKAGTMEVTNHGDGTYDIVWDFVDDTPARHAIRGSYSGPMDKY